jgi:hypothetical protein
MAASVVAPAYLVWIASPTTRPLATAPAGEPRSQAARKRANAERASASEGTSSMRFRNGRTGAERIAIHRSGVSSPGAKRARRLRSDAASARANGRSASFQRSGSSPKTIIEPASQ